MFKPTPIEVVRPYEVVVLLHPDATEEEQKALFLKNKTIIESFSGKVNHLDTWGKRRLANRVKKISRAIYFHSTFTATPEAIAELERTMKINDRVIRCMHTRLEEKTDVAQHLEKYRETIESSRRREKEREARFLAKRAARSGGRREGPRRDRHSEGSEEKSTGAEEN